MRRGPSGLVQNRHIKASGITDACIILLKWDALELGRKQGFDVVHAASDWLEAEGMHVLAVWHIKALAGEQVDKIYGNIRTKPYFVAMRESLVNTPAIAIVIGGGDDVATRVRSIKGDPDTEGTLRWRWSYKRQFEKSDGYKDWLARKGKYADELQWQKVQYKIYRDDKIHSSDSRRDTLNNFETLFPDGIIKELLKCYPQLARTIRRY
jgi:nucleoside diphosphate kinase